MPRLSAERCFLHPGREAAARCPDCGRFFCRECVTEHHGRVLCRACLAVQAPPMTSRARLYGGLNALFQFLLGTFFLWLLFYYLGRILMSVPDSFHEGTIWGEPWLGSG